jgi:uncharacterized RDD family membrane protein YckC
MTEQQPPAQQPQPTEPSTPPPQSGWSTAPPPPPAPTPVAGAAGLVYADVPNRAIAYIIDVVILVVINVILGIILFAIFGSSTTISSSGSISVNWLATIVYALVGTAISAVYFIYTWTSMRGTVGQKALSMQVANAADGRTLTQEQAVKRWIYLGGPIGLIQALTPVAGLGLLIGLLGIAYFIYLLWTTAQSPTKQGFHDIQAGTAVVKAARTVS